MSGADRTERAALSSTSATKHAADLLRVSYLAPEILTAIISGKQPADLTRARLIKMPRMPLGWQDQRAALGFAGPDQR